jgi:hypothetical protein
MGRPSVRLIRSDALRCSFITVALLTVSAPAFAANLLINGGFESGNVGFSSEYVYSYDMDAYGEGKYYVGSNPRDHNPQFFDMTAEEGSLMMIVNGALQPGLATWRESGISVLPHTNYDFSAWVAEVSGVGGLASLRVSINGVPLGTMTPTPYGDWREFHFTWDSGSSASADVTLVDLNTDWNGNDFAIDNMRLEEQMHTATTNSTWGKIKDAYR